MCDGSLTYYLYRDDSVSNDQIIRGAIELTKDFVFEGEGLQLISQGYSGVPLKGSIPLTSRRDDVWKIVDVLFKLSEQLSGLVFSVSTDNPQKNPFFVEVAANEVLPKNIRSAEDFTRKIYGCGGVLHYVSPSLKEKLKDKFDVDIVRENQRETRNILATEAVRQRIIIASMQNFGMQRTSANLPSELAYIAKQRPDLLSAAIRELDMLERDEEIEKLIEKSSMVMVHVNLNAADWKKVTDVADIESPPDIVSHRLAVALLQFDRKYAAVQNGAIDDEHPLFEAINDSFEKERCACLYAVITGKPYSTAHNYQTAKLRITDKHQAECRKLFVDGMTSTDGRDTNASGEDDYANVRSGKKHVLKKKKELGKKRTLAAPPVKSSAPSTPCEEFPEDLPTPTSSGLLKHFERAVNGDDKYKESSDERSLGEEEDLDLFVAKPKPRRDIKFVASKAAPVDESVSDDNCNPFDVSELLQTAPPLAEDEFDDIDDF